MTKELERQRTDLVTANTQLTERRRFMEAVLSGVSAGVIGLDRHDRITLASRSAEKLLGREGAKLVGQPLAEAVPEFAASSARPTSTRACRSTRSPSSSTARSATSRSA